MMRGWKAACEARGAPLATFAAQVATAMLAIHFSEVRADFQVRKGARSLTGKAGEHPCGT